MFSAARYSKYLFWLMALAALTIGQKSQATGPLQNFEENLPTDTPKTINTDTIRAKILNYDFSQISDPYHLANFISSLEPRIKSELINVKSLKDIEKRHGFYNPISDTLYIRIFHCDKNASIFDVENKNRLSGEDLQGELDLKNKLAFFVLSHELDHMNKRNSYSRVGFTRAQFEQMPIHEENNAPVEEMLLFRDLFIQKPNNATSAVATTTSGIFKDMNNKHLEEYYYYLKKRTERGPALAPIPDEDEINAIVKIALNNVNSNPIYLHEIPRIVAQDIRQAARDVMRYRNTGILANPELAIGFDAAVQAANTHIYKGQKISCLSEQSIKVVKSFVNAASFKNNIKKYTENYGELEEVMRQVANDLKINQSSLWDASNPAYAPNKKIPNRGREK